MNKKSLNVIAIQTTVFHLGQNLSSFVIENLGKQGCQENDILAVTSKIVSLSESRVISKKGIEKTSLVKQESDHYLGEIGYGCSLTIKESLLIPSAGIDESNSEKDEYILYPVDPFLSAKKLRQELLQHYKIKNLGIILTDSHTTPLRHGVTGVGLSYSGFKAIRDKIGHPDIFGREMKMTKMNLLDGLAAVAVLLMGEADERCPLARIQGADVEFCDQIDSTEIQIPWENDLYYPLYKQLLKK